MATIEQLTLKFSARGSAFKDATKKLGDKIIKILRKRIDAGYSPVTGRKFKGYSDSYKKAIRKGYVEGKRSTSPVNLRATGQMLDSLDVEINGDRSLRITIDSPADFHNKGTDKMPARQIFPDNGRDFSGAVSKEITRIVQNEIVRVFKSSRRR